MSFKPECTIDFENIFKEVHPLIENFEGCNGVKLLKDKNNPCIYFTHSYWQNEEFLNNYRHSELFNFTWQKTKILFNDKPLAWSLSEINVSKN